MARPIAADHQDKRIALRRAAARLFAEKGYEGASMNEVAAEAGVSKALLYHYYDAKDALLYDIIETHLIELVDATEKADDAGLKPRQRLAQVINAILDSYRDADAEHKIQINHMSGLPAHRQERLKALERRLVAVVAAIVAALNPQLPARYVKPASMALFGTLNWKYMWFREGGSVTAQEFADMTTELYAAGVEAFATAAPRRARAAHK